MPRNVRVFAILAVINEIAHLHVLHKVRYAPHMVIVEVRDEHVIDLCNARVFHRRLDPLSIATVVVRPARIDQH